MSENQCLSDVPCCPTKFGGFPALDDCILIFLSIFRLTQPHSPMKPPNILLVDRARSSVEWRSVPWLDPLLLARKTKSRLAPCQRCVALRHNPFSTQAACTNSSANARRHTGTNTAATSETQLFSIFHCWQPSRMLSQRVQIQVFFQAMLMVEKHRFCMICCFIPL